MIDTKEYFLQDALNYLKNEVERSVVKYFRRLLVKNIYFFIAFVTLLAFGFILFLIKGYKRLKNEILNSKITLSLIPNELLKKE